MSDGSGGGDAAGPVFLHDMNVRSLKESKIGNIVELVFTYGAGLCLYSPYVAALLFFHWEFKTAPLKELNLAWTFAFISVLYFAVNVFAAMVNTQARFTRKTFRFFMDFFSSLCPIIVVAFAIVLMFMGSYQPTPVDMKIMGFVCLIAAIDLIGHSNLVQTAVRRVHEGALDR